MMDANHLDFVRINSSSSVPGIAEVTFPGPLPKIVSPLFGIESGRIRTEVTLPYFGANPRLFFIWICRSHHFLDKARRWKLRLQPIRACSRRRTTGRSGLT